MSDVKPIFLLAPLRVAIETARYAFYTNSRSLSLSFSPPFPSLPPSLFPFLSPSLSLSLSLLLVHSTVSFLHAIIKLR